MDVINTTMITAVKTSSMDKDCPIWTKDDTIIAENITYYIDGIFVCMVAFIGLILNSIGIFIIYREDNFKYIFYRLMGCLFCINNFLLGTAILTRMFVVFKLESFGCIFPQFSHPLHYISLTASIYLTIAAAYERHVRIKSTVYFNHLYRTDSRKALKQFLSYSITAIVGSILFNIPKFLEFTLYEGKLQPSYLVKKLSYLNLYQNWGGLIAHGIIPYTILFFFNMKICMELKNQEDAIKLTAKNSPKISIESRDRKISPGTKFVIGRMDGSKPSSYQLHRPYGFDHISQGSMNKTYENERTLAKICMGIVTLFLVCHLIRVLDNLNIIMIWDTYVNCKENGRLPGIHVWQYHLTIFGFVFVVIHSAINMPLYYILNVNFRKNLSYQLEFLDQRPIIRQAIRRLSDVKGEPDGASEPILADSRRLSDFSSTTIVAPTLKSSTTMSQSSPDVVKANKSSIELNESLRESLHNITNTSVQIVSTIPNVSNEIQKPLKGTIKRKMTFAKSAMTPLVAKQNTMKN